MLPLLRPAVCAAALLLCAPAQAGLDGAHDLYGVDPQGTVYMLWRPETSVRRWSLPERRELEPIELGPNVLSFAWWDAKARLLVQYLDGELVALDPLTGAAEPFASTPRPCGVAAAGASLIACSEGDPVTDLFRLQSFDVDGALQDEEALVSFFYGPLVRDAVLEWSASLSRVYFGDSRVCYAEVGEEGEIAAPECSDPVTDLTPLRPSPDGTWVLLVDYYGSLVDGVTLTAAGALDHPERTRGTVDGLWLDDGRLLTAHADFPPSTELRLWDTELAYTGSTGRTGEPRRLLRWNGGEYLVVRFGESPYAWRVDPDDDPPLVVPLSAKQRLSFAGLGSVKAPLEGYVALDADGSFSTCQPVGCLAGDLAPRDAGGRRFDLRVDELPLAGIEASLQQSVGEILTRAFHEQVTAALTLDPSSLRFTLVRDRSGTRARLRFRVKYRAQLSGGRRSQVHGALSWTVPHAALVGEWPAALP